MAQRPGFDMARMSTASKILAGAGLLYLIDLFLPWQRACVEIPGFASQCGSASGIEGIGVLNLLLALAIVVMEGLTIANVQVNLGTPQQRGTIEAALAGALLLFTLIKILVDNEAIYIFAWIGLILAAAIGYGGYMRWQESKVTTPPPGGGFTP